MDKQAIQKLIRDTPNNKIMVHVVPSHLRGMDRRKAVQKFVKASDRDGTGRAVILISVSVENF